MYAPQDIVWPGEALKPPEGLPEKRFIRASFLEEDPYVMLGPPSTCDSTKGVLCYMVDPAALVGVNITEEAAKLNSTVLRCCSGFCVDLLNKFSNDLSFDFHMVRVKDGKWGGVENGEWNGLVAELINKEADIVMTSVKINSGREEVIDFSVPFLEVSLTSVFQQSANRCIVPSLPSSLSPSSPLDRNYHPGGETDRHYIAHRLSRAVRYVQLDAHYARRGSSGSREHILLRMDLALRIRHDGTVLSCVAVIQHIVLYMSD